MCDTTHSRAHPYDVDDDGWYHGIARLSEFFLHDYLSNVKTELGPVFCQISRVFELKILSIMFRHCNTLVVASFSNCHTRGYSYGIARAPSPPHLPHLRSQ